MVRSHQGLDNSAGTFEARPAFAQPQSADSRLRSYLFALGSDACVSMHRASVSLFALILLSFFAAKPVLVSSCHPRKKLWNLPAPTGLERTFPIHFSLVFTGTFPFRWQTQRIGKSERTVLPTSSQQSDGRPVFRDFPFHRDKILH
jgi:hypothetical protein